MKSPLFIPLVVFPFLSSCDLDAVGDKVDELKDLRKESTQGVEGMDIKAIVSGMQNTGPTISGRWISRNSFRSPDA